MTIRILAAAAALALPSLATAQIGSEPPPPPEEAPGPSDIVNAAQQDEWVVIAPEDLLVMTLAPAADGSERKVVIQLMPAPFSQGWVENIRTLARAEWYDGISVNRVQDNYVVQWGDPGHDNPESGETETKPLPEGLNVMDEADYSVTRSTEQAKELREKMESRFNQLHGAANGTEREHDVRWLLERAYNSDPYAVMNQHLQGWPYGINLYGTGDGEEFFDLWPVHCYGMVGVGRSYSPDTGSGAELYTVSGHAPRHLDRNIALVGRIISGMKHLTSLPRGSGALGFYTEEESDLRTPILSIRVASDLPLAEQPQFEYLSTESASFAKYADARANRRDPFFIVPAGGADICNIPVPIRRFEYAEDDASE